jgi:2-oxoglutarate dehydrogenase E2 component (dihydrolipoamide succinyltransferase)
VDLVVPKLGESITEAIIAKWLKNVGEGVAADEGVVELETDKVSVTVPAPAAGVLSEQRAKVGETVTIGAVLGAVTPGAAPAKSPSPSPSPSLSPSPSPSPSPSLSPSPTPRITNGGSVPHSKT